MAVVAVAGCASPWELGRETVVDLQIVPMPAHQAVHDVTLKIRGHEVHLVGYVDVDPARRAVRANIGTEMGLTGLDVEVRDGERVIHEQSALADFPGFAEHSAANLERTVGARSMFALLSDTETRAVKPEHQPWVAARLPDGSWVVFQPRVPGDGADPVLLTLLTPDLYPEAEIRYEDRDDNGIFRLITLHDIRDRYELEIDVVEVISVEEADE